MDTLHTLFENILIGRASVAPTVTRGAITRPHGRRLVRGRDEIGLTLANAGMAAAFQHRDSAAWRWAVRA